MSKTLKEDSGGEKLYDDYIGTSQFVTVPITKSIRNYLKSSPDSLLATQLIGGCSTGYGLVLLLYSSYKKE